MCNSRNNMRVLHETSESSIEILAGKCDECQRRTWPDRAVDLSKLWERSARIIPECSRPNLADNARVYHKLVARL
jgi:hypothetical protein